ncbi:MAG TPA: hypothetical protein VGM36_05540 [Rhizomicrobium sp.]|jgi:hypothetical protein
MSISKIAAAMLIAGGVAAYGTSATANEAATSLNCMKMSKQVKDALYSHPQFSAHDAAEQEQKTGADYCMKGFYKAGMTHFEAALKIIGGSATAEMR